MSAGGVVEWEAMTAAFDRLDDVIDELAALSTDTLNTGQWLELLARAERVRRRLPAIEHPLINELARQATEVELGGKLPHALADRLLISRTEAARRIAEAADLGPRYGLTGEVLPPLLEATAAAQRAGDIGGGHVGVIRRFWHRLPGFVDVPTREHVEANLADIASKHRPEELRGLADLISDCLNPDGNFTDKDRARRRGLTLGPQGPDGMSELRGLVTPELRATIEAVWAKLAAPGMCNPDDDTACVQGSPSQQAIDGDLRSTPQRHHDGLLAGLRGLLCSGKLGQHNGLPASIIVTTTLAELKAAAGTGLTGGGTMLPMSEVLRQARHAHHYLAIFDKGQAVALYHTKRLASPGQRIVLYAKDRGCSAPGCDVRGYYCEVHHVKTWAQTHTTDINELTFACGTHHKLLEHGWTTRKNAHGDTEWIPPPPLDHNQPRTNLFHHPEKLLRADPGADDGDEHKSA